MVGRRRDVNPANTPSPRDDCGFHCSPTLGVYLTFTIPSRLLPSPNSFLVSLSSTLLVERFYHIFLPHSYSGSCRPSFRFRVRSVFRHGPNYQVSTLPSSSFDFFRDIVFPRHTALCFHSPSPVVSTSVSASKAFRHNIHSTVDSRSLANFQIGFLSAFSSVTSFAVQIFSPFVTVPVHLKTIRTVRFKNDRVLRTSTVFVFRTTRSITVVRSVERRSGPKLLLCMDVLRKCERGEGLRS